jgi:hypothetical protein
MRSAELVTHISCFFCSNKLRLFRSIKFYWIVNLPKNSAREGNNFTKQVGNVCGCVGGGGSVEASEYVPSVCAFLSSDTCPRDTR